MSSKLFSKFVILAVLDGWGIAPDGPGNAISLAKTPNIDRFWVSYPHTQLDASGDAVGLPHGEAGNTETGHLNLGAGRIVYQDLARINMAIADGSFFENEELIGAINHAKKEKSDLHLMGLVGAGGVHSNIEHLFALIQLAKREKFTNLYLHLFTDGRDSPPTSALTYVKRTKEVVDKEGVGQIASLMGRFWAMDRDQRWERTGKAYSALTKGEGAIIKSAEEAINESYSAGRTDEFIDPYLIAGEDGKPIVQIKDNDSVIFFNFRIDRPRQLTKMFVTEDFSSESKEWDFDPYAIKYEKKHIIKQQRGTANFKRGRRLNNLYFVMMTEYGQPLEKAGAKIAFHREKIKQTIGTILSDAGHRQLRLAESEKERFVTFYFNGQQESRFDKEERIIILSPKVNTYDQKPEMASKELTDALLKELEKNIGYTFVLINYASPDMVGHTGNIGPATVACESVDEQIGRLANYSMAYGGTLLITADHGNVEEMINLHTGEIDTEHSVNPVPFIAINKNFLGKTSTLQAGILADVSPTILALLGLNTPYDMTGHNLLKDLIK